MILFLILCFLLLLVGFEVVSLVRYIHGGNITCCCFLLYVYQAILLDAGIWMLFGQIIGLVVLVVLWMSFRLRLACASSLGTICVGEAYIY